MSSFDAMLTTVSEDVREAIEEVCDEAGTFDADWCILKAAGELIVKSRTLPPVSPEDLVEGEWYAWKSAGNIHVGQVYSCGTDSTYIRCGATGIPVMDWNLYYGPLKFEIGGAE